MMLHFLWRTENWSASFFTAPRHPVAGSKMSDEKVREEMEKRLKSIAKHYGQVPLVCNVLSDSPDLFVPYTDLSRRLLLEPGRLTPREAELAAVAAGAALASEHCLDVHIAQAMKCGAEREDVLEAIMIGSFMAMTCGLSVGLRKLQDKD